jgi:trimeric autotransporter adhesin
VGDYILAGPLTLSSAPGGQVPANLTFTSMDFYSGQVNATCDATALPAAQCTLSPPNPITIASGTVVAVSVSINVPNDAAAGLYNTKINTQDISGAPGSSLTMALTVDQDFSLGSLTPATRTITVGESASYNFSVLPVGASFTGAVTLSCSSVPVISALCSFTPNPATPSSSAAAVVMTVNTTSGSAGFHPLQPNRVVIYAMWMALPGVVLLGIRERAKHARLGRLSSLLPLLVLAWLLSSCRAGGVNGGGGGGGGQGTQPGTYTITVTGTSGSLSHAALPPVTLVVSP